MLTISLVLVLVGGSEAQDVGRELKALQDVLQLAVARLVITEEALAVVLTRHGVLFLRAEDLTAEVGRLDQRISHVNRGGSAVAMATTSTLKDHMRRIIGVERKARRRSYERAILGVIVLAEAVALVLLFMRVRSIPRRP